MHNVADEHEMAEKIVTRKFIRMRERNQITLPSTILSVLPISSGDFLEVCRTADGVIHIKPTVLVTVDSPGAIREESLADEDIANKRYETFASATELVKHLKNRRKRTDKVAAAKAIGASTAQTNLPLYSK